MALQTASMVRAVGISALRPISAAAAMQGSGRGSVSMSLHRRVKPSPVLRASRRCGLCSMSSRLHLPRALSSRPFSQAYKPAAGQWKAEDSEGAQRGYGEGNEVEVGSNEFPRPPTVQWSKELANTVHLIGHVGRDMEIKYLDTGKVVAKSSLAVSKPAKKDDPSWFEMEFWDSLAEIAGHHLKKGDSVYVTGRVVVDTYLKNELSQRITKVVVSNLSFVENIRTGQTIGQGAGRSTSSSWSQSRPSQSSGGKAAGAGNAEMEKLWNEYFSDPTQWWDNRAKKASPKSPDFKHKTTHEALWVVSYKTPAWVPTQLEKLEAARQQYIANGGGGRSQNNRSNSFSADFKDF